MVSIRLGKWRFAPSMLATALTAIGMLLFIQLGLWQLGRADDKRAIIAQYNAGQHTQVDLDQRDATDLLRYQRVRVSGRYDPAHQVLLDNMPSVQGRPGYRVLTPFQTTKGEWLLVDRGWVPPGPTREVLPEVDVAAQVRTIAGRLEELPQPGMRLGEPSLPSGVLTWPQVMNFPRREDLQQVLDRPLAPRIVALDADQPDGYERSAALQMRFGPERHVGYAVQWFALALAVLVTFLVVNTKLESPEQ